jgi:flagellar motor switch protein FliN
MALTAELTNEAIAACRQNAGEASEALSRALGATLKLLPDEIVPLSLEQPPAQWQGAGLAVVLKIENEAALALLPESSGFLPSWYAKPDATGTSKLTTLAQELGMVLLPESHMPLDFAAGYVENIQTALQRGGTTLTGGLSILLQADDKQGTLYLLWPATAPDQVLQVPASAQPTPPASSASPPPAPTTATDSNEESFELALAELPPYIRSLLQIKTAVSVQLASRKQPVSRIVEMGPGTIVQFDRQCEQPLELFVNNLKVAEGEVVKVGDKFGLRITNILLPHERFLPLQYVSASRKAS